MDFIILAGILLFIVALMSAPIYIIVEAFNRWNLANVRRKREAALMDELDQ